MAWDLAPEVWSKQIYKENSVVLCEKAHKYDKTVQSYREATHKTPCVRLCGCIIATTRQGAHRNLCLTKAEHAQLIKAKNRPNVAYVLSSKTSICVMLSCTRFWCKSLLFCEI